MSRSMGQPRRCGIYVRVSDPKQQQGASLATQEAECRAKARALGCAVDEDHVYAEVHTGVDFFERPALSRLRAAIRSQEFDVLLCHGSDRLSRDPIHLGVVFLEAQHHGIEIEFVTVEYDDSEMGELKRFMDGWGNRKEREKLKDRSRRGRDGRLNKQRPLVGPRPPYGYRWANSEKSRLEPDPTTAPIVVGMFRQVAAGGSARQVALRLTREGVPTATGKASWAGETVIRILKNPAYAGKVTALRQENYHVREPGRGRVTRTRRRPPEEQIVLPEVAPALVPEEVQRAALAQLPTNKTQATRNNRNPEAHLLRSGFAKCGYCGHTLSTKWVRGNPCYVCAQVDRYHCPRFGIAASILDAVVWARVESVLTKPAIVAQELERLRGSDPTRADQAALDRQLSEVNRKLRNLVDRVADEDNPDVAALLRERLALLAQDARRLEEMRAEVAQQRLGWEQAQAGLADIEAWCENVAANLVDLTYDQKRLALNALGATARVWKQDHDPRYEITLRLDIVPTSGSRS